MTVALCLITWNELDGCKHDVPLIDRTKFEQILCVDGGSTDGTVEYLKEQGKYPVIFLTLKECKYTYWDSAYRGLKLKIEEICDSLGYLLDSDKLTDRDKVIFKEIIRYG